MDQGTRDMAVKALVQIESHIDECAVRYDELKASQNEMVKTTKSLTEAITETTHNISKLEIKVLWTLVFGACSLIVFLFGKMIDMYIAYQAGHHVM